MPSMNGTELIRTYLNDRTIGCPVCRYNLRGVSGESCPECGATLELQLSSIDLRLGWWMAGVLSVAFPMGFSLIMAGLASFGAWRSVFWSETDWWTFSGLGVLTLFYGVCLTAMIRRRRKFLRMSRMEQRIRALGVMGVMLSLQFLIFYVFKQYV